MIVGISGFAGSGKDTAAEVLIREYGFTRVAFADALRDMAYAIDPMIECHSGPSVTDPGFYYVRLRSLIDQYGWDYAKNTYSDVRRLLQRLGTEAGREILGEDIWVKTALDNADANDIVVTDVRFPNELQGVYERRGYALRIERPGVGPRNDHASETSLTNARFSRTIINDGTIEELHQKVIDFIDPILEREEDV